MRPQITTSVAFYAHPRGTLCLTSRSNVPFEFVCYIWQILLPAFQIKKFHYKHSIAGKFICLFIILWSFLTCNVRIFFTLPRVSVYHLTINWSKLTDDKYPYFQRIKVYNYFFHQSILKYSHVATLGGKNEKHPCAFVLLVVICIWPAG